VRVYIAPRFEDIWRSRLAATHMLNLCIRYRWADNIMPWLVVSRWYSFGRRSSVRRRSGRKAEEVSLFLFRNIVDSRVYYALALSVCWTGYLRSRSGVSLSLYVINILILYSQSATWLGSKIPGLQNMPCIFVYR